MASINHNKELSISVQKSSELKVYDTNSTLKVFVGGDFYTPYRVTAKIRANLRDTIE